MAIRCFVRGCSEDVIGQCPGLENEPCGHFYCAEHSKDRLCDECAVIQERNQLMDFYTDAISKAQPATGSGCLIMLILMLTLIPLGVFSYVPIAKYSEAAAIAFEFILVALGIVIHVASMRKMRSNKRSEAARQLPMFDDFYQAYSKGNKKDMLILAGSLAAAELFKTKEYSYADEGKMRRDVMRIKKRLTET